MFPLEFSFNNRHRCFTILVSSLLRLVVAIPWESESVRRVMVAIPRENKSVRIVVVAISWDSKSVRRVAAAIHGRVKVLGEW